MSTRQLLSVTSHINIPKLRCQLVSSCLLHHIRIFSNYDVNSLAPDCYITYKYSQTTMATHYYSVDQLVPSCSTTDESCQANASTRWFLPLTSQINVVKLQRQLVSSLYCYITDQCRHATTSTLLRLSSGFISDQRCQASVLHRWFLPVTSKIKVVKLHSQICWFLIVASQMNVVNIQRQVHLRSKL